MGVSVETAVGVVEGMGVRVGVGTAVAVGTPVGVAVDVGVGMGLGVTVGVAPAWQATRNNTRNQVAGKMALHNLMKLETSLRTLGNDLMRHLLGRDR